MSKNQLDPESASLVEEAQFKRVATMLISGVSVAEIAREMGTTPYKIRNITKTDEFKDHLKEVTDHLVSTAANQWKSAMSDRVSEALKVIDFHLKRNDLESVKLIMKSIGVGQADTQQVQSGALTVVLPSFDKPKDVEVEVK